MEAKGHVSLFGIRTYIVSSIYFTGSKGQMNSIFSKYQSINPIVLIQFRVMGELQPMNTLNRLPVYLFIYLFIFTLVPPSGCSMNRHQTQLELIYEQMMSNLISFKKRKTRPLLQYILLKYTFSLFTASVHCFLKLILFPQTFTFFLLFLEPFYPSSPFCLLQFH